MVTSKFSDQSKLARSKTVAINKNKQFRDMEQSLDRTIHSSGNYGLKPMSHKEIEVDLVDKEFQDFAARAYASEDGYAIRVNKRTGQKEMFVAGTRYGSQWALNALDSVLYNMDLAATTAANELEVELQVEAGIEVPVPLHKLDVNIFGRVDIPRHRKQRFFEDIAAEHGIHVLYGHSRGGSMIADMDFEGQKIGLDAAMIIAHNKDMLNINEGQGINPLGLFDEILALTGEDNVHFDASPTSPHRVWNN